MPSFIVNSTGDTAGDTSTGAVGGGGVQQGTLRQAINYADANPGQVVTVTVAAGLGANATIQLAGADSGAEADRGAAISSSPPARRRPALTRAGCPERP